MSNSSLVSKGLHGIYRRRIVLHAQGSRTFAALEDDFHHLYVDIEHDGRIVTRIAGKTLRIPRTTCPSAADQLKAFKGLALDEGSRSVDARQQCTHLFDIARAAMAHALRGGRRKYDIIVPDPVDKKTHPEIRRDDQIVLAWDVLGNRITGPQEYATDNLFGKVNWKHFDAETVDAAMLLRRAVWVSYGRGNKAAVRRAEMEGSHATALHVMPTSLVGACYSHQPEVYAAGSRMDEYIYDFTDHPDALLSELAPFPGGIPPSLLAPEHV